MSSYWDESVPYERKIESNWCEDALGIIKLDEGGGEDDVKTESFHMEREDVIPGKEVFLLNPCFTPQECKNIIDAAEMEGYGRTSYPKKYRGNYRLITTDDNLASLLWSRMKALVPQQVDEDGCVWEATGLNECFRLSKYCDGDVFQSHVDTCFERNSDEKSMFTVNIYLNGGDEFNRGKTRFYSDSQLKPEYSVTPIAGLGLIFRQPPSAHYTHDGEMVCNGFKYLIRSDIMYRKI
jgi:hypothetical protein